MRTIRKSVWIKKWILAFLVACFISMVGIWVISLLVDILIK